MTETPRPASEPAPGITPGAGPDPVPRAGAPAPPAVITPRFGARAEALSVMVVGAVVVAWLTRYNMQPYPAWAAAGRALPRSWEEFLLVNVTALVLPAVLWITLALRRGADDFGVRPAAGGSNRIALGLYAAMLPVLAIASRQPMFRDFYPMQSMAAYSLPYFVYFEATYGMYMLCWEFFYRGFLTLGMARWMHPALAIGLQATAFGVMHLGKPPPEIAGSFVAGAALGLLALRGRSFVPCFVLHWAVSITFDLLVIAGRPGAFL